jgi:hypothetical protein
MQGMKSDSTAGGIINRIGKQMIEIDNIDQQHDKPGDFPSIRKCPPRDDTRDNYMKYDMKDRAEYDIVQSISLFSTSP